MEQTTKIIPADKNTSGSSTRLFGSPFARSHLPMDAKDAATGKRGKGRPTSSDRGVGREALIEAARALLQELPPAQVTSTAVARRANGDPALVRYYFGNRENLLFEVAKRIGQESNRPLPETSDPIELLTAMVHNTFRFTHAAKHMQRLMIEELAQANSLEVRQKTSEWNRRPLANYARVAELDTQGELDEFDPLFMHLAVVGICDFFVSGEPMIRMLVPKGTDMTKLERKYEAFVTRLVTKGLRRR